MKITTSIIRIIDPSAQLFCESITFDYIDVVGYSTKPDLSSCKRILWCITKSSTSDDISWYGATFDRQKHLAQFGKNHTVLTERYLPEIKSQIVVKDIFDFLKKVHRWVLSQVSVKVVGVTGSVGKTTCVCMLEDVFSNHGKTLRVYSKRITPLSLFEIIINQLTSEHRYVVMEYSMYYKHHITVLVDLLPPDVGIILNIDTAHLGVDGINSADDIWHSKSELLRVAKHCFAEKSYSRYLTDSIVPIEGLICFEWSEYFEGLPYLNFDDPFIKSKLTYTQIGASLLALETLIGNVSNQDIQRVYSSQPRENRLSKVTLPQGVECFFDGEVTNSDRLFAFGDTLYSEKTLILKDVEFYDQILSNQSTRFNEAMRLFDHVYVYSSLNSKFCDFVSVNCDNAQWFDDLYNVTPKGQVFMHWGAYWRLNSSPPIFRS